MTTAVRTYHDHRWASLDDPADISEVVKDKASVVWVDLLDPSDAELDCVRDEFELHPLAMEDARKHGQRPKLEHYPTHAFLVAYSKEMAEVDLFIGPNWIVCVRERNGSGETWSLENCQTRLDRGLLDSAGVGQVVYHLLDSLVDGYFAAADGFEDQVEAFEDRVLSEQLHDEEAIQAELLELRRRLIEFRRVVVPVRDVVAALIRGDVEWLDEATRVHLQDVFDHVLRATEQLDSQRELVGNAVDAHLAIISNRMNQVMKRMTSWGAILLGSTLVAGIYGMNFEDMPELGWRYGYPFALGLMALITIAGYRAFSRRDWL